ncbi:hypothetical protein PtB15_9B541 [Puccinia triticina]|nr:hypothetical protein PtB15_9B541 [Puccinia triticina]
MASTDTAAPSLQDDTYSQDGKEDAGQDKEAEEFKEPSSADSSDLSPAYDDQLAWEAPPAPARCSSTGRWNDELDLILFGSKEPSSADSSDLSPAYDDQLAREAPPAPARCSSTGRWNDELDLILFGSEEPSSADSSDLSPAYDDQLAREAPPAPAQCSSTGWWNNNLLQSKHPQPRCFQFFINPI